MAHWLTSSHFKLTASKSHSEAHYLIRPADTKPDLPDHESSLVTVFHISGELESLTKRLESQCQEFRNNDDVFRPEFLQGVIVRGARTPGSDQSLDDLWQRWGTRWQAFSQDEESSSAVPPGPYVVRNGRLAEVWRLYSDHNKAFLTSVWPSLSDQSAFTNVQIAGTSYSCLAVPVPSRLYTFKSAEKPLAGLRVGVKDCFHLKGVKTSCASRGFLDVYPEQSETAQCIQSLIDKGAHIVGKLHLSSLAMREDPTQCVDFQAPFNPRADGYQSPAGSSSGSGTAIASYDWLDITIGTDTTGSGRRPALWNGSFSMRPSGSILSHQGMVPTCPRFDSPSFFARGVADCKELVSSWYGTHLSAKTGDDKAWAILWPTDFLPVANAEQMQAIREFTGQLSKHLKTEPQSISLAALWEESNPPEANGEGIHQYLENVQAHGFFRDFYQCFDDFRTKHKEMFGTPPYVTEIVSWMWGIGRLVSEQQRNEAFHRFDVFRQWLLDQVLKVKERNAIMILPIEMLEPRYRDTPPGAPSVPPKSINVLYISPVLLGPELAVPAGEVAYYSRITERTEFLPCAVSLLGPPGSDLDILNMVEEFLKETGRPLTVDTGRSMGEKFPKYSASAASSIAGKPWLIS